MQFEDFSGKLKTGSLSIDDTYWIADFRFNNVNQIATRNLPPTEVKAFSLSMFPVPNKDIYSEYYFKPLGKTGKPLSTVIVPYFSKGSLIYAKDHVEVFLAENDAKIFYQEQGEIILQQIKEAEDESIKRFMNKRDFVNKYMDMNKPFTP